MKSYRTACFGMTRLFLLVALLMILAEPTCAQTPDLIQGAKKEAEVTVFGSLENDVAAAINKGFEAKYGIKTNYFRGSSTVIIDRITSAKEYDKKLIDDFFGPNYRSVIIGFIYNKNMIKPEDAPKSYEDIVSPKWKGKIAMGIRLSTTPLSIGSQVSISSSARLRKPMTG